MKSYSDSELVKIDENIQNLKKEFAKSLIPFEVEKIKREHENYIKNKNKIWKRRFTYSPTEQSLYYNINIPSFLKDVDITYLIRDVKSSKDWYKFLVDVTELFLQWTSQNKKTGITELDKVEIPNFIKGMLGEYFSNLTLSYVKRFIIDNKIYDFDYITPFLGNDYGIDTVCVYDDGSGVVKPMVCQIKTWNPKSDFKISYTIANSCWSEGIRNNYISDDGLPDKKALVIWLGDMEHVSVPLKRYAKLFNQIAFIDSEVFDMQISSNRTMYWEYIQNEILNIKNL